MSISYPASNEATGLDTPISVAYNTSNTVILPANATRAAGGIIVNNATKTLWVSFTNTAATVGGTSIPVPPNGGALDLPANYRGAVNGIWALSGAGAAVIHEFNIA